MVYNFIEQSHGDGQGPVELSQILRKKFDGYNWEVKFGELSFEGALDLKIGSVSLLACEDPKVIPFVSEILEGISSGHVADKFDTDSALSMAEEAVGALPSFVDNPEVAVSGEAYTVVNLTVSFVDALFKAEGESLVPDIGDFCEHHHLVSFVRECADKFGLFRSQNVEALSIPSGIEQNADTGDVSRRCVVFNSAANPSKACVVPDNHVAVPLESYVDSHKQELEFLERFAAQPKV